MTVCIINESSDQVAGEEEISESRFDLRSSFIENVIISSEEAEEEETKGA